VINVAKDAMLVKRGTLCLYSMRVACDWLLML
jgi:hypothetical protein